MQISCPEVGPDFFRAMRIRVLQGRTFQVADMLPSSKTAIVDEAFARAYLPGNPIGRWIRVGPTAADDREVIGVVASTRPLLFLQNDYPAVYRPLTALRHLEALLVIGYDGPRGALVQALKALAPQLDREVTYSIKPIEENVSTALSIVRTVAGAVATLGVIALVLACTGVYGVVAFTVGRRRREIGIRLALGARGGVVMRLLLWQSLKPVFLGAFLGTAVALAVARLMRAMLYGLSPLDPIGFGTALLTLAAVAAIAAGVPAFSTLRIDPAATLRHD